MCFLLGGMAAPHGGQAGCRKLKDQRDLPEKAVVQPCERAERSRGSWKHTTKAGSRCPEPEQNSLGTGLLCGRLDAQVANGPGLILVEDKEFWEGALIDRDD